MNVYYKIKNYRMNKFIIFLVFTFFSLATFAQEDSQIIDLEAMMSEIRSYAASRKEGSSPFVTDIVKKHVPFGLEQDEVLKVFQDSGFDLRDETNRKYNKKRLKEYDSIFRCQKKFHVPFPLFHFFWGA